MSDPYAFPPQQPDQPSSGQPYYPPQQQYPPPQQYPQQPFPGQPYGYGPQMPVGYPPQPPVKKRRTGLIVSLVVVAFALVACSGIVAVAIKFGSDDKTASPGPTATGKAKSVTLKSPDKIGALKKSADQTRADKLSSLMSNAGIKDPFAAVYEDTKHPGRSVAIWGGTGAIFGVGGGQTQLDGFFRSAGSQFAGAKPQAVDPGAVGGKAECAKSDNTGMTFAICAWVGTDALLGFLFNGVEPDAAGVQMRAILPSIVA